MDFVLLVLLILVIGITGTLVILVVRRKPDKEGLKDEAEAAAAAVRDEYESKLIAVSADLETQRIETQRLKEEKSRILGEKIRTEAQLVDDQASLKAARESFSRLEREKIELESRESSRKQELARQVSELENSRKTLELERERITAEEKQRMRDIEENRNRVWAMHEQESIIRMRDVCSKPEYAFPSFDNTNLPDEFDQTLKPDFMIEFLDQYIIFDAKISKSASLQIYIQNQVKNTVKKIKSSPNVHDIYKTVFFVVPTVDAGQLKTVSYYEDGYSFYVIPIEAFEPVAAIFRKLKDYDLAEAYDPQERENIVNLIAAFDNHIRQQNAVNILNTLRGLKIMGEKQTLPPDLTASVEERRKSMRLDSYKPTDLRRLMSDPQAQIDEIAALVMPGEPAIDKDAVQSVLGSDTKSNQNDD
ncbi:MAG: hypothetical protein HQ557_09980 [Bacteroidetes bacterium]|nr:hypothetical protein [Bacteroidota bacterium]